MFGYKGRRYNRKRLGARFLVALILLAAIVLLALNILLKKEKPKPTPLIEVPVEETIRIKEGWTTRDLAQYFEELGKWPAEEFLDLVGHPLVDYRNNKRLSEDKQLPAPYDFSEKFSFLADKPEYYGLEGYLFPDTYRIYASSTPLQVLEKILANFDAKLTPDLRKEIARQGKTIYEIIIMASLIEKEAPVYQGDNENRDARLISGIFWNRLNIGQGLQADATLSYILNDNKAAHSGAELEVDSPYNTYKYRGLPPGPISNPSLAAIKAAIYPLESDYYYFLTTPDKKVFYARTYNEHLNNKYKYLK
ncbi:MAG: endolytic transglycosylase MltG [Patescibacteria group bacterium]